MKKRILILFLIVISLAGCDETVDLLKPIIILQGEKMQVVYQHAVYHDPGAYISGGNGRRACAYQPAEVNGTVDVNVPGYYLLIYTAVDDSGSVAAPATRTVHVVENPVNFLSGVYNVACSCTAIAASSESCVTSDNYIAAVLPGSGCKEFDINRLKIGHEFVTPFAARLDCMSISLRYFGHDFHPSGASSGTLSVSKNSFTIDTRSLQLYPAEKYGTIFHCRNVYENSKQTLAGK